MKRSIQVAVAWLLVVLLGALTLSPVALAAGQSEAETIGGIPLAKLRKLEHEKAARGKGINPTSTSTGTTTTNSAPAGTTTGAGAGTGTPATSGTATTSGTASTPGTSTPTAPATGRSSQEIETEIKELEQGKSSTTPSPVAKHSSSKLSGAGIALIVVAAVAVLAALLWAVFSFAVLEPHWLLSLRHSLAEAGYRASAVWAEFADWVRLGH